MSKTDNHVDRLKCICNGAIHAIVAVDTNNQIVTMNPAAEKMRGIALDLAIGHSMAEVFPLLDMESRTPISLPTFSSFKRDPLPRSIRRAILVLSASKEVVLDAVFWPTFTEDNELLGYAMILTDIRETIVLERTILDRQKIEAIGSMAAGIARDFNAWLGVISGHASAAIEALIPKTRAHEAALRILETTRNASSMIDRLMAVANTASVDVNATVTSTALASIVQGAVDLARSTFMRSNVTCKIVRPSTMPSAMVNPTQLMTCLMNILRNAVEAMPEGGTITIDSTERVLSDNEYVVLRVRDTGRGISQADRRRLFDPFFSTKPPTEGAVGLGLTVVQSLVGSWGGFVKVRSHLGHGSSFRVFLPKAEAVEPVKYVARTGGELVLVADDSERTRTEIEAILKEEGCETIPARNAEECLRLFRRESRRIRIAIVDAVMPGDNVDALLDDIIRIDSPAVLILTSGFSRDFVRDRIERGAWHFLQKPVEKDQLLALVRRLLRESDEQAIEHAAERS